MADWFVHYAKVKCKNICHDNLFLTHYNANVAIQYLSIEELKIFVIHFVHLEYALSNLTNHYLNPVPCLKFRCRSISKYSTISNDTNTNSTNILTKNKHKSVH